MTHTPSLRRMARTWEQSVAGRLSSLKWSYLHRLNIRAFQQLLSILRICCSANFNSFHSTPPTFLEWWWKLSEGWCLKSRKRASEREVTNDKTQSGPTYPTGVQRRRGGGSVQSYPADITSLVHGAWPFRAVYKLYSVFFICRIQQKYLKC